MTLCIDMKSYRFVKFVISNDYWLLCVFYKLYILFCLLKGTVSDGNSYALGGIAGHAGLFSTSEDIFSLMHRLMFASPTDKWINSTTVAYFTKVCTYTMHNAWQLYIRVTTNSVGH